MSQASCNEPNNRGFEITVKSRGGFMGLAKCWITPTTTIRDLEKYFQANPGEYRFEHLKKTLNDQSLQMVASGDTIIMVRQWEDIDVNVKQPDGCLVKRKISPDTTIQRLESDFRVSPGAVKFCHEGVSLTNENLHTISKGATISMVLQKDISVYLRMPDGRLLESKITPETKIEDLEKSIGVTHRAVDFCYNDFPLKNEYIQRVSDGGTIIVVDRSKGFDVSIGTSVGTLKRRITNKTTVQDLEKYLGDSYGPVYFLHHGKVLTNENMQKVSQGDFIRSFEKSKGFSICVNHLDGRTIKMEITPATTIQDLEIALKVYPGCVAFFHQNVHLTNENMQRLTRGDTIDMEISQREFEVKVKHPDGWLIKHMITSATTIQDLKNTLGVLLESPEEVDFVYQESPLTTKSLQKLTEGDTIDMVKRQKVSSLVGREARVSRDLRDINEEPTAKRSKATSSLQEDPVERYKMSSSPKGICLIINNVDFGESRKSTDTGLSDRDGSDVDESNLNLIFTWLGFEVKIYKNKKALEMWKISSDCSKLDHSQYDCFVTCVLSHGGKNLRTRKEEIFGVDGKGFPIDDMIQLFDADSCRSLIDKPKLFFLQCCRGANEDKGMPVPGEVFSDGIDDQQTATFPMLSDIFIGYATPSGFKSWRNTTEGSWYISKLCEVFSKLAKKNDLMTMITKVNGEVSKLYTDKGLKQVPNPSMTLTKLLYFNPILDR